MGQSASSAITVDDGVN